MAFKAVVEPKVVVVENPKGGVAVEICNCVAPAVRAGWLGAVCGTMVSSPPTPPPTLELLMGDGGRGVESTLGGATEPEHRRAPRSDESLFMLPRSIGLGVRLARLLFGER